MFEALLLLLTLADAPYGMEIVVTARPQSDSATAGVVTAQEIERQPFHRPAEVLERVPGVVISQHSGEGKANQYYLRGFNLDHGTDVSIDVAGAPVNMPTHAHGQGYADLNFVIPELVGAIEYRKGPYFADEGDFSSAGAMHVNYREALDAPIASLQGGSFGYGRALVAASHGPLLYAIEASRSDGPWLRPDDMRKVNGVLRLARGNWSATAMAYDARWNSTDQVPQRAVDSGAVERFGHIDDTNGGETHRYSLSAEWRRGGTRMSAYAIDYALDLFSNFTYYLDDPVDGDQFEQLDERRVFGGQLTHRWTAGRAENLAGLQLRRDDIATVGLYHTRARRRLSTTAEDSLAQTGAGVFAQSTMRWTPRLRTVAGLRADTLASQTLLSPKFGIILAAGPGTELYANGGYAFHSNDLRIGPAEPLVRTRGAELGVRRGSITAAAWMLDIDSELVFVGDAGTTEARPATRRAGVEVEGSWNITERASIDADLAWSRARFRNGDRVPGAVEGVASIAFTYDNFNIRYRFFGPRPLIEDDSIRSEASHLITARLGFDLTARLRLNVDVFNLLDADASDVDYFYESRLPGESHAVGDVHTHPAEPRSVRVGVVVKF